MPLKPGSSRADISHNIKEMRESGHPEAQAVAAALRESEESKGGKDSMAERAAEDVNFKDEGAYKRWLAYGHMHGDFHGKEPVSIGGAEHHVNHGKDAASVCDADPGHLSGMDAVIGHPWLKG